MGLSDILNVFNLFGHQIGLRYKGEDTYHTKFGSFISLVIWCVFAGIFFDQFALTLNKT